MLQRRLLNRYLHGYWKLSAIEIWGQLVDLEYCGKPAETQALGKVIAMQQEQ